MRKTLIQDQEVRIPVGNVQLEGNLTLPEGAKGIVLFAHGSGSSRFSPRNRFVADALNETALGTLLIDLLNRQEEAVDTMTAELRFDIPFLAERLTRVIDWLKQQPETRDLAIGLFGASTGGGAALMAAVDRPDDVLAVVSRGGRPDLAGPVLPRVKSPTLLIVGGEDPLVIDLNRQAFDQLKGEKRLWIVPGATHLFEEPGTLEQVAGLAAQWFAEHLS